MRPSSSKLGRTLLAGTAAALLGIAAGPAPAAVTPTGPPPLTGSAYAPVLGDASAPAQRQTPRVSLDQAVAKVRSRFAGRVIRAETRYNGRGEPVHYIKLLSPDGRVRTVKVDGLTGRIR